jgi:hypothetical protein
VLSDVIPATTLDHHTVGGDATNRLQLPVLDLEDDDAQIRADDDEVRVSSPNS